MPWYRTPPASNYDWDRYDVIHAALNDRKILCSPYSLNQRGRTVAIAHLLILLNAMGITATSIQILGDIITSSSHQPSIKDLRPILAKMHLLTEQLRSKRTTTTSSSMSKEDTTVISSKPQQPQGLPLSSKSEEGSITSKNSVQTHILYRKPNHAMLCGELKQLHLDLATATNKWRQPPIKLADPTLQLLREIYDQLDQLLFPIINSPKRKPRKSVLDKTISPQRLTTTTTTT